MKSYRFYIVDVFAEEKYAGNQLAVFRKAKDISDANRQKFAKEMHFSETTFIKSDEEQDGGYDVRIFTPEHEIPFAGHPTLGTAFVIQQKIVQRSIQRVVLNLKVGQIPVDFQYRGTEIEMMWMKQINPSFGATFDANSMAKVLNLDEGDIDDRYPIQEVSTGTPFIMVPLKTLKSVKRSTIDKEKYFDLIMNAQAKAILVFCPETYSKTNQLNVRVYADYYGVPEDPATGSANGCLAGYLARNRYFGKDKTDIRVEQGYEIGRPSSLLLKSHDKGEKIDVFVGGRVQMIAQGEFI